MQVWPAIDLRGGRCVRLRQGDYQRETVYGADPAEVARGWVERGASRLHLVDLDGARDGRMMNVDAVAAILRAVEVPCQLGGGVRDVDTLGRLIESGIQRVVIGTIAVEDPDTLRAMSERYPGRVVLGIDARDGRVATAGWLETAAIEAVELARRMSQLPLAAIVYTDIQRDGMLEGANVAAMERMKRSVTLPVIASGGVTTLDDIRNLRDAGLDGCIVGRALYEGRLDLAEALAVAEGAPATEGRS